LPDTAVSADFSIMQIRQSAAFLDGVVGGSGAQWDTAGLIRDGREVFLSALMPETIEPVKGDEVKQYLLISDAFDTSRSWRFCSPTVRTVCANTARLALKGAREGITFNHSKSLHKRIDMALAAVAESRAAFQTFGELASVLAKSAARSDYFSLVADEIAGDAAFSQMMATSEQISTGPSSMMTPSIDLARAESMFARASQNRSTLIERFKAINESPTNLAPGSLWGAYNAVTQYANHEMSYQGSEVKRRETRLASLMGGRADRMNEIAMQIAQSLVA